VASLALPCFSTLSKKKANFSEKNMFFLKRVIRRIPARKKHAGKLWEYFKKVEHVKWTGRTKTATQ
jgi:hypothetical protein